MKKLLAVILTIVMVMTLSLTVFAAPSGFVSSPSGSEGPILEDFENADEDCESELELTHYGDRDELDDESREILEDAYESIVNASDLGELNKDLEDLAEKLGIPVEDLAVSDLFDISSSDCDGHSEHGEFTITLNDDDLKDFVGLMRYDGENWHLVDGARISDDGTKLIFTSDEIGAFAIVTNTGSSTVSPPTGDNFTWIYYVVVAAVVAAMGLAFVVYKTKKRA